MLRDLARLKRLLELWRQDRPEPQRQRILRDWSAWSARSMELARQRRSSIPSLRYPPELPVSQRRDEIVRLIDAHQVVVLCGETGSGKTTQLPKMCLEMGRGVRGFIGHTQPRRIAARSVAARVATELGVPLGGVIGYKVRFGDKTSPESLIKLMTDGILLAETRSDPNLEQYDTLIIDEAHERSLNIDFLLGYLRQLLPRRPELKLIITSATIDPLRFSRHFGDAPVIEVSGRTFPVEVRYRPLAGDDLDEDLEELEGILRAIEELWREGPGDTLVFLPGERDIRQCAETLRKHHPPHVEVLPLYSRLPVEEQMRVFQPHGRPRIVLATNVAETSLTVPGIRYVIDPGLARIGRYSARSKVQRLPVEPISRASADQRKGRCGRVSEGVCVRLYSKEDFEARPAFTDPEIRRTSLASVILQMLNLRLGRVEAFPFMDPPDGRQIRDGYHTLLELGAIDEKHALTPLGRTLARIPIDPRLGRILIEADREHVLDAALVVVAALAIQDPRVRPADRPQAADEAHGRFRDERSDFLGLLKLWDTFHLEQERLSNAGFRKWCRASHLSYVRLREWQDLHSQLLQLTDELGMKHRQRAGFSEINSDSLHRALLAGLLSNIGMKGQAFEYDGARGTKFHLFPGSALFKRKPRWIVAAELVETSRLYARTVGEVKPEWIERIAPHLARKSWFDPFWNRKSGHVCAYERVTVYGLEVVSRRTVHFGPQDPAQARQIFIQHALAQGEWPWSAPFFRHNEQLVRRVERLVAKVRRRDLLSGEEARFAFYDRKIPEGIYNVPLFDAWRKEAEKANAAILFMHERDLLREASGHVSESQFPDTIRVGNLQLPLDYRFEPGHPCDGVTATVPLAALNQLPSEPFEWLVPGLLVQRIEAMIRLLPKQIRTRFVPVPDHAAKLAGTLRNDGLGLREALSRELTRLGNVPIPRDAMPEAELPEFLRMNFRVIDNDGKVVGESRDLDELRRKLGGRSRSVFVAGSDEAWHRDNLTRWDFPDLPPPMEVVRNGVRMTGYPAIVDAGNSVSLRLLESADSAAEATRKGLRRLYFLQLRGEFSHLARNLAHFAEMKLHYKLIGHSEELRQDLLDAIADRAFFADQPVVATREAFVRRAEEGWKRIPGIARALCQCAFEALKAHSSVRQAIPRTIPPAWEPSIRDLDSQLSQLLAKGFVTRTPITWFPHLPRFIRAAGLRLEKLRNAGLSRDLLLLGQIEPLLKRYRDHKSRHDKRLILDPELETIRWMLEELRVSLFAQELRTSIPISIQRIEKQWERVIP
jgi:ATP-dependent helicase HrpA